MTKSPPSVPLAFRVGVTGHRLNKLPETEEQLSQLRNVIHHVLSDSIQRPLKEVGAVADSGYSSPSPRLLIISPLAEGADRLVAEEALALGFELQCPLPFSREEYAHDFDDQASKDRFERFVAQATAVLELNGRRAESKQAYEAVGRVVLRNSDLLIAIWDGQEPELRGGTSQIIEEAKRLNVPVIWIQSQSPHDVQVLNNGHAGTPTTQDLRKYLNNELLLTDSAQIDHRKNYVDEVQPAISSIAWIFRAFVSAMRLKIPQIRWKVGDYVTQTSSEWEALFCKGKSEVAKDYCATIGPQLESHFLVHFAWADKLANFYGDRYRSSFTLTYGLSGFAVASAMAYLVLHSHLVFAFEFVLISWIIALTYYSRKGGWQRKWLDYRYLAESIRYTRFLWPLGRRSPTAHVPAHHRDGDPRNTWVNWLSHAIERNAGLVAGTHHEGFCRASRELLAREVKAQIEYHLTVAERFHMVHHRLHRIGYGLFFATVFVCLFHLIWDPGEMLEDALVALSATFPALGAACAGILSQGEFHRIEVRSRFMAAQLQDFNERLNAQDSLSVAELGNLAEGIAETMLTELVDWRVVYIRKPLDLPA